VQAPLLTFLIVVYVRTFSFCRTIILHKFAGFVTFVIQHFTGMQ